MGGRNKIAEQGIIGGGSRPLAEVRTNDELIRRVAEAQDSGEDPTLAKERIRLEMAIESLSEAFGANAVRVLDGELDKGTTLHNAQVDNLY